MHNWFECKISYDKNVDGVPKKVSESYLVDAMTFAEAEARIIEIMQPFISGEYAVQDIKRVRFYETFLNYTGSKYYKVKIILVVPDEKSGAEKRTSAIYFVQASTVMEAIDNVNEAMKGSMQDYEIAAVNETALLDVFPFEPKTPKTPDAGE
jgi:hypothetical protein